jgi:oligosaccharide repeat unit polymerase
VNFDLFEALRQMSLPRFAQSWSRGRYGDAYALLYEIGALIYLIPPIAGLIYARSQDYNLIQRAMVTVVLLFTLYFGFASGTRNIVATYVITFLGAYFLTKSDLKLRQVLYLGVPILILLLLGMSYMLAFRAEGLSNYSFAQRSPDTLYIDHNMVIISRLTELFPNVYEFLGFEIPYQALIRPIPRALWPGKPEGLSVSVEAALGADPTAVTFASTFVGEAYMSGGFAAVLVGGLLLGAVGAWWNGVGRDVNSPFAQLLYASGFLCAALTMRSIAWTLALALPTVALWIYGKLWHRQSLPISHEHGPSLR